MATLHLTLKKKWFDMIASGEKKEEYREIKKYWFDRLIFQPEKVLQYFGIANLNDETTVAICENPKLTRMMAFKQFDTITFRNGYQKNAPEITVECLGIDLGEAKPEWSDNWQGNVFRIKLGKILKTENQ